MEFLRFGSSIPGSYWGCCACCIIQNFKVDPDTKASIQILEGDGGTVLNHPKGGAKFAGMTYREIFWHRLRFGTFSDRDMPNHAFIAILSETQLHGGVGKKWLAILKEAGFEFVRKVNNSVWNVNNYIFMLVRNVGPNAVADMFAPPQAWVDLEGVVPEAWEYLDETARLTLNEGQKTKHKDIYDNKCKGTFYTEEELVAKQVPITLAGKRSRYPQQLKNQRESIEKTDKNLSSPAKPLAGKAAVAPTVAMGSMEG